ncbi:hypothetical protein [Caballeronia sp. GAWG1-5s-s]|nr:hypothetical protein [Caballeronia sp. GAWG1-5s-s]
MEKETKDTRRPAPPARERWAEASKAIAESGEDAMAMGEFANADDAELTW